VDEEAEGGGTCGDGRGPLALIAPRERAAVDRQGGYQR
jgi:hypothetical protein